MTKMEMLFYAQILSEKWPRNPTALFELPTKKKKSKLIETWDGKNRGTILFTNPFGKMAMWFESSFLSFEQRKKDPK